VYKSLLEINNSMMYAIDKSRVKILQIDAPTQTQSQKKNQVSFPKRDQRCINYSMKIKLALEMSHSHPRLIYEPKIKIPLALIPC
jgi:hypothetical protein